MCRRSWIRGLFWRPLPWTVRTAGTPIQLVNNSLALRRGEDQFFPWSTGNQRDWQLDKCWIQGDGPFAGTCLCGAYGVLILAVPFPCLVYPRRGRLSRAISTAKLLGEFVR